MVALSNETYQHMKTMERLMPHMPEEEWAKALAKVMKLTAPTALSPDVVESMCRHKADWFWNVALNRIQDGNV